MRLIRGAFFIAENVLARLTARDSGVHNYTVNCIHILHSQTMSKVTRQNAILDLVEKETIASQEQLRKFLLRSGFDVTQATLSRDIHELGLVKTSDGYAVNQSDTQADSVLPPALRLVREFVVEVREAQNLLVVKTAAGSAQPVAAAIDSEGWSEIVGTVGGDDTILIISPTKKSAHKLATRLRGMLE